MICWGLKNNADKIVKIKHEEKIKLLVEDIGFYYFERKYDEKLREKSESGVEKNGRDYTAELSHFRYKKECIRDTFDNDVEDYRSCIEFYFRGKQLFMVFKRVYIYPSRIKNGGYSAKDKFFD